MSEQSAETDAIRASVERGLANASAGRAHDLGSFAKYRDAHPEGRCLSVQCVRCYPMGRVPTVLDLDDPYFDGQTLPDALKEYDHVHSSTGVCVKSTRGLCVVTTPGQAQP